MVTIDGSTLPGSSIADLVNDSPRLRMGLKPLGRDAFAKALAKINTPESIVRNDDIRKQIIRYKIEKLLALTPSPPEKVKQLFPTPPSSVKPSGKSVASFKRNVTGSPNVRRDINWLLYD